MDLYGIGYSNIRLPNDSSSYIYTYDIRINTFPEEVFVHEFLHTLERNMQERDFDIPELHDNEIYHYEQERLIGLKNWYKDYMTCNIKTEDGRKIGLHESVYKTTPPAISDFKYTKHIDFNNEPSNLIEEIRAMFNVIGNIFNKE